MPIILCIFHRDIRIRIQLPTNSKSRIQIQSCERIVYDYAFLNQSIRSESFYFSIIPCDSDSYDAQSRILVPIDL